MRLRISYSRTRRQLLVSFSHSNGPEDAHHSSASFPTSLPPNPGSQARSWCDPAIGAASEPCPDAGVTGKTEWHPDGNSVPPGPGLDVWTTAWKWGLEWGDQKLHLFLSESWSQFGKMCPWRALGVVAMCIGTHCKNSVLSVQVCLLTPTGNLWIWAWLWLCISGVMDMTMSFPVDTWWSFSIFLEGEQRVEPLEF